MPKIRVTKRFHFEIAHTLFEYVGLCQNIHGHSYNLEVTLIPEKQKELIKKTTGRVIIVGFQPTSENIVAYIAEIVQQHLPSGVASGYSKLLHHLPNGLLLITNKIENYAR